MRMDTSSGTCRSCHMATRWPYIYISILKEKEKKKEGGSGETNTDSRGDAYTPHSLLEPPMPTLDRHCPVAGKA